MWLDSRRAKFFGKIIKRAGRPLAKQNVLFITNHDCSAS